MSVHPRTSLTVAVVAALSALSATAAAQRASLGAVAVRANHRLLGDPLLGAAIRVDVPLDSEALSLRLGAEHALGSAQRTGVPCGGLIQPGTCAAEPVRDDATLTTGMAGFGLRVLSSQRFVVDLTGDVRAGLVRADTRGLTSGQSISASKTIWGGDVGVEGSWMLWARLPIALEVSAAIGGLTPVTTDEVVDGYTPFEGSFAVKRISVAVAWSPRPR